MTELFLIIFPILSFITYLFTCLARIIGKSRLAKNLDWLGLALLCLAALSGWVKANRLPVYGLFESSLHITLVLALSLEFLAFGQDLRKIKLWGHLIILVFLGLSFTVLGKLNPDFYMYQAIQVQLFFFLRLTAGGILICAFLFYIQTWIKLKKTDSGNCLIWQKTAKNSLLLGSIFYLGSELSGTLWCMQGWGDMWHWSKGFFESTAMFLLLMLPIHSSQWLKTQMNRARLGACCTGIVVLGIILP